MTNQFTQRELLLLFNVITEQGKRINPKNEQASELNSEANVHDNHQYYELDGIRAWHDFDGYTCWLGLNDLVITLSFHGTASFEFKQADTLNLFNKKLSRFLTKNE